MTEENIGSTDSVEGRWDEFLKIPSTLSPELGIDLYGFASEEQAKAVGDHINSALQCYSRLFNLRRLHHVIVAFDYSKALAELDRGIEANQLKATNDDIAVGIAMTPTVIRKGELRSVIVLNAIYTLCFVQRDNPDLDECRDEIDYTLAHECAHVHDLEIRAKCMSEFLMRQRLTFCEDTLFTTASGCWDEYIASRLSAVYAKESTLRAHKDTFCKHLDRARERADSAIRQFRSHHDLLRVTNEVSEQYRKCLIYASYLLGHVDGLERTLDDAAPEALKAIDRNQYFAPVFVKLQDELHTMYATYGTWSGLEVYEPLKRLMYALLMTGGIVMKDLPDGQVWVDVPVTPDTVPTLSKLLEPIS
jgi:hypothetical protein